MFLPPSPRHYGGCARIPALRKAPHRLAAWLTCSFGASAALHDCSSDSTANALEASLSWMIRGYNDLEQVADKWISANGNPPDPACAGACNYCPVRRERANSRAP